MNEQLNLIDDPAVRIDSTHWDIFDGDVLVGTFEVDSIGYGFISCVGPTFGGGGPIGPDEDIAFYLNHIIQSLRHHYRKTKS